MQKLLLLLGGYAAERFENEVVGCSSWRDFVVALNLVAARLKVPFMLYSAAAAARWLFLLKLVLAALPNRVCFFDLAGDLHGLLLGNGVFNQIVEKLSSAACCRHMVLNFLMQELLLLLGGYAAERTGVLFENEVVGCSSWRDFAVALNLVAARLKAPFMLYSAAAQYN
ncbi:hypothetical protein Nepgr_026608 [Nepenthes gracilis]|uniref:Uncharacterized protein n=1 Tax=Nepenthes gracilis TaxID=150966 RepID=A0AAD3Y269_NEPGR|nr:hypothetical protein Nepgr_026608 [Nepenthes gracilis]